MIEVCSGHGAAWDNDGHLHDDDEETRLLLLPLFAMMVIVAGWAGLCPPHQLEDCCNLSPLQMILLLHRHIDL